MSRAAAGLASRLWLFAGLGGASFVVSGLATGRPVALVFLSCGLTCTALVLWIVALRLHDRRETQVLTRGLALLAEESEAMTLGADYDGQISFANAAARKRLGAARGATLNAMMDPMIAQPATMLYRLQNRAIARGATHEDIQTRDGRMRVSVHRVGEARFVWQLDQAPELDGQGRSGEGLALPMMTVSRNGAVVHMNQALRRLLGGRETSLDRIFAELPMRPGEVNVLRAAHGTQPVLVVEMPDLAGRREIYLLPEPRRPMLPSDAWAVVESLPVALVKLDRAGRVTLANAGARRLLGREEVIGLPMAELIEGLGRTLSDWLDEAWMGRNLGRTETVKASARSDDTFLQISLEKLRDESGDALIIVMNDATELKSLEGQFVQSQKMQAIGQLAGGVAHDFNNLLTAISGHCDLLLLRHEENDQDYADLIQIHQNANRAAALVRQLLAFSRKQTLRADVLDLSDSMSDLTHLLGRLVGERVKLDLVRDSDLRPVRADKRQLDQVIVNLVVNARDAMLPEGGTVRLEAQNVDLDRPLDRDRVRVPPGEYVAIRVVDQGHGIPADRLTKVFEPFFTTKGAGKGTGLGLSMAYGIVKQSGGYIFVDSVEGSGATFSIYLPVYRGAADPAAKPAPGAALSVLAPEVEDAATLPRPTHRGPAMRGGHVLLVEDEAPVRAFAARALRLRGYVVTEAESAEDALRLLSDEDMKVDVVVTDVVMPGMDGPTWVARALQDRPGVKVVFVSGYAEESVSEHQKRIPNSVFLPKPFSLEELTSTVSAQIQ